MIRMRVYAKQAEIRLGALTSFRGPQGPKGDKGDKGDKGEKGEPGYTPVKGVDYYDGKDGYTPVKDVDYFDGKDGHTPVKGVDYYDGEDGHTPVKGVDYFDGEDGYTPVKGVDYWTEEDQATLDEAREGERRRAAAESAREQAEQGRVAAEDARAQAQEQREADWQTLKSDVGQAADDAAAAARDAMQAEAAANDAAARADTAAQKADEAASGLEDRLTASERALLDRVCPPFEQSGSAVACTPVEGYPLDVVTRIEAVQEGEGDPSPENVRPIAGWDSLTVTRNDDTYTQALPETVYGGSYHWATGELTVTHAMVDLGDVNYWSYDLGSMSENKIWVCDLHNAYSAMNANSFAMCSEMTMQSTWVNLEKLSDKMCQIHPTLPYLYACDNGEYATVKEYRQACKGRKLVYRLADAYTKTLHLTPQQILSMPGVNTLSSDAGDTTVSGREDPIRLTASMLDRLAALEAVTAEVQR